MSHEKVQNGDPFVKMYMNTEKPTVIKYRTIIDTSVTVFREEGMSGFFAGLRIRMAIQSISSAIAWGTYQIFKSTFNPNKLKH